MSTDTTDDKSLELLLSSLQDVGKNGNNVKFLYVTLFLIIILLVAWIVLCIFVNKNLSGKILIEMLSPTSQITPILDGQ